MRTIVGHLSARRFVIPALLATALTATDAATRYARLAPPVSSEPPVSFLATPVPLRPFAAVDLDGRDVSPATWRGRITLVNVWATWCAPCRDEIPMLVALQEKYRDQVLIIGVVQDRASDASVKSFAASLRMNYPIVRSSRDIEHSISTDLALPMTYVVDPAGRVVASHAGRLDPAQIEREIQVLLSDRPL